MRLGLLTLQGLDDNNYTYNVSVNDTVGNSNDTGSRLILLDTVTPGVSIQSPSNVTYTVSNVSFNLTLDEAGSEAWFTLTGGVANYSMDRFNSTFFNYTNSSIGDGSYTVQFYVNDSAGNLNDSESIVFSVETSPPLVTVNFPANTTYGNSDLPLEFNLTLNEIGGTVVYSFDNGASNVTMSSTDNLNYNDTNDSIVDGSYVFQVYSNDSSGNRNDSVSVTFSIESTLPLISYADGMENTGSNVSVNWIFVNVSVTETNEDSIVFRLYNDTGLINTTIYTDSTRTINFTGLDDNNYTYNVTVNDTFGNSNDTTSRLIKLDTTNIVVIVESPSSQNYSTSIIGFNISLDDDGSEAWFSFNSGADNYTMTRFNSTLFNYTNLTVGDGDYIVQFYVNDTAGNLNNTVNVSFGVDTIVPLISYGDGMENTGSNVSVNWVFVNVSVTESREGCRYV